MLEVLLSDSTEAVHATEESFDNIIRLVCRSLTERINFAQQAYPDFYIILKATYFGYKFNCCLYPGEPFPLQAFTSSFIEALLSQTNTGIFHSEIAQHINLPIQIVPPVVIQFEE